MMALLGNKAWLAAFAICTVGMVAGCAYCVVGMATLIGVALASRLADAICRNHGVAQCAECG